MQYLKSTKHETTDWPLTLHARQFGIGFYKSFPFCSDVFALFSRSRPLDWTSMMKLCILNQWPHDVLHPAKYSFVMCHFGCPVAKRYSMNHAKIREFFRKPIYRWTMFSKCIGVLLLLKNYHCAAGKHFHLRKVFNIPNCVYNIKAKKLKITYCKCISFITRITFFLFHYSIPTIGKIFIRKCVRLNLKLFKKYWYSTTR